MPRTTATSNPTNLIEIARQHVTIDVVEDGAARWAALTTLDLATYDLDPDLKLILVARAGSTFSRFELGTVALWDKSPQSLDGLDAGAVLRFRLLLHSDSDPCLRATAENLVARTFEDAESFFAMQPADLGDVAWELRWANDEPTLLFNQTLFPNARGAIAYAPFAALVLPEVVRQVAVRLAVSPERLMDESDSLHVWNGFIERLGIEAPSDDDEDEISEEWVRSVVSAFATHHRIAADLRRQLTSHGN